MAITDLTGTIWIINQKPANPPTVTLNFTSNGSSFSSIKRIALLDGFFYDSTNHVYHLGKWNNQAYRIIEITGGTDATNDTLITWLQQNAKLVTNYQTNTIEIVSIADAIRTKGGTSASLAYPTGFVSAIEAMGGVAEDALITRTISGTYENSRVTKIGSYAFAYCSNLTTVSFPSCTTIGNSAFGSCASLTSVNFSVCTSIGNSAFYNCYNLTTVSFPSCTTIGSYAFGSCSDLTSVNFSVCTSIGNSAFGKCASLTTVSFPVCTSIGSYAFSYCTSLTTVSFPVCTSIGSYAFCFCTNLTSVSFPACTSIGGYAFSYCYSLTTVSFPVCTSIGSYAFYRCYELISLYLTSSSFVSLAVSNAFSSTPIGGYSASAGQYGSIYVPASMLASYKTRTNWTYFSSRMVGV